MITLDLPGFVARPWQPDDLDALVEVYRDPEMRSRTLFPVTSAGDGRRWLDVQRRGWESGERLSFAVLDAHALVANVVLKRADPQAVLAEVGYWTAAHARGRGIAPRAVRVLGGWAVATYPSLVRLELLHQVDNVASCRVAEKAGYPLVEVLPARYPYPLEGHRHVQPLDSRS